MPPWHANPATIPPRQRNPCRIEVPPLEREAKTAKEYPSFLSFHSPRASATWEDSDRRRESIGVGAIADSDRSTRKESIGIRPLPGYRQTAGLEKARSGLVEAAAFPLRNSLPASASHPGSRLGDHPLGKGPEPQRTHAALCRLPRSSHTFSLRHLAVLTAAFILQEPPYLGVHGRRAMGSGTPRYWVRHDALSCH